MVIASLFCAISGKERFQRNTLLSDSGQSCNSYHLLICPSASCKCPVCPISNLISVMSNNPFSRFLIPVLQVRRLKFRSVK